MRAFNHRRRHHLVLIRCGPDSGPQRQARPTTLRTGDVAAEWRDILNRLGMPFAAPPFMCASAGLVWWLPGPQQLVVPALSTGKATLSVGERLDAQLGQYGHRAHVDELSTDLRVVFLMTGGLFSGYRGRSRTAFESTSLFLCAACHKRWFLSDHDSWECRSCGYYDSDRGIDEAFIDVVPPHRRAS